MFETLHKSFPGIHTEPRVAIKLVRVNICNTRSVRQASRLCDLRLLRDLQPERLKRIKLFSWKDSQGPAHPLPPCNCMTFSHDILNCVYGWICRQRPTKPVCHTFEDLRVVQIFPPPDTQIFPRQERYMETATNLCFTIFVEKYCRERQRRRLWVDYQENPRRLINSVRQNIL